MGRRRSPTALSYVYPRLRVAGHGSTPKATSYGLTERLDQRLRCHLVAIRHVKSRNVWIHIRVAPLVIAGGRDKPGQEHSSRDRRQHRRQMKAEPHVVPSRAAEPRTRRQRVDRGSGPLSPAAYPWGNFRRRTSFGGSWRTRPNRSAPTRRLPGNVNIALLG
jgi:hypothetical protein